jgi:hypothetical protein
VDIRTKGKKQDVETFLNKNGGGHHVRSNFVLLARVEGVGSPKDVDRSDGILVCLKIYSLNTGITACVWYF